MSLIHQTVCARSLSFSGSLRWPVWLRSLFIALGAAIVASGTGPRATGMASSGGSAVRQDLRATFGERDDSSSDRATGAFLIRPFGTAILQCTGTLIGPRVVITAAHCVANRSKKQPLEFTLSRDAQKAPAAAGAAV